MSVWYCPSRAVDGEPTASALPFIGVPEPIAGVSEGKWSAAGAMVVAMCEEVG